MVNGVGEAEEIWPRVALDPVVAECEREGGK
jgi:hypothetical protein